MHCMFILLAFLAFVGLGKMHGARRVICFCFLTAVLPTVLVIVPLYLRHSVYADVTYAVAESDVLEMVNGVSSIFCQVSIYCFYFCISMRLLNFFYDCFNN